MKNIFLVCFLFFAISCVKAQVATPDSLSFYGDKIVTVYGRVMAGSFIKTKRNDTTVIKMRESVTDSVLIIKILPADRVTFGYRPEFALLYKTVYATGKFVLYKGKYELVVSNPFDFSFRKTNAYSINQPQPVAKAVKSRQNNETSSLTPAQKNEVAVLAEKKSSALSSFDSSVAINSTNNTEKMPAQPDTIAAVSQGEPDTYPAKKTLGENPNNLSEGIEMTTDSLVGKEITLRWNVMIKGGPGSFFDNIVTINKGEVVKVISCSLDWCRIRKVGTDNMQVTQGYVPIKKLRSK